MTLLKPLLLAAFTTLLIAGCGDAAKTTPTTPTVATASTPEPAARATALDVSSPQDDAVVHSATVTLTGTTDAGASVSLNGRPATVAGDGAWQGRAHVELGRDTVVVSATAATTTKTTEYVSIERRRSARERAAFERAQARRRARREAARRARRQRAQASFKAGAKTIPYNVLHKDADRQTGKHVVYRGQIFQIQEDGDNGGIMLLSVTDEGYGFWSDNVWVDYDHSISAADDDVVTVYGTITGSKSYETQIGGETYVPRMHARYIERG